MICSDIMKLVSKASGKTLAEIGRGIGMTEDKFGALLRRDTLRVQQLLDALEYAGVSFKLILNRNGLEVWPSTAVGMRRVRRMVDRVIYDTSHATPVSNDFDVAEDSMHQLLRDFDGRYFIAEYNEDGHDRIIPCTGEEAAEFLNKYGVQKVPEQSTQGL